MTAWVLLSSVCAALAAGVAARGTAAAILSRRLPTARPRQRRWSRVLPRPGVDAAAIGAGAAVVLLGGSTLLLPAVTAILGTRLVLRLLARHRERRRAAHTRRDVVAICDALSAEMLAGQPAVRALQRVAESHPRLAPVARAAVLGADVSLAFDDAAAAPGAGGLRGIAAAWRVSERTGARLTEVLDRVAAALRVDEATAAEVAASLGPPRATAQLLAVLPVLGLLLGDGLGGDPIGFLLGSFGGQLCLVVGTALAALGVWWVERLADAVEGSGR